MSTLNLPSSGEGIGEADLRRRELFRETFAERGGRIFFGIAWALHPKHIGRLVDVGRAWMRRVLGLQVALYDLAKQPAAGEILGIADELSVPVLVMAYAAGLFPHGHVGTPKWLSPTQRCVLFFKNLHISKRLRRLMRQGRYTVTFDRDFEGVIKACAARRDGHDHITWITPRIMHAYAELFDAGYAHSFEVWNADGKLVGGGYGVAVGRIFTTESQFSLEPNTSKLGFTVLNCHLAKWGYLLNDGKGPTPTILDMGCCLIPRAEFLDLLAKNAKEGGKPGPWSVEAGRETVAEWQEAEDLQLESGRHVATG
ncbi:MAG TPA: leucyl/phenylalanyl-tRNA--protein transferase [Methyloceanibacter sp.]|nr:leucyl/phenylalanyl-tRNA--protein transferase [Methyloceanibacter sp.]